MLVILVFNEVEHVFFLNFLYSSWLICISEIFFVIIAKKDKFCHVTIKGAFESISNCGAFIVVRYLAINNNLEDSGLNLDLTVAHLRSLGKSHELCEPRSLSAKVNGTDTTMSLQHQ